MGMQCANIADTADDSRYVTQAAFLTTDIKKYCLSFRRETMARFAAACDEMYGLKDFFNWQHNILEESMIYVADPYCPPSELDNKRCNEPPEDGSTVITNPLGWIEGYQQKAWTMFSIAALQLAATKVGVRIAAVVLGDNQVAAVTIRCPAGIPWGDRKMMALTKTREFAHALAVILASQGQILKESETIISGSLFIYGKRIIHDGSILPQSLKAASRNLLQADTLLDDTRSAISGISTSCAKVQNQGGDSRICFLLSLFHGARQLAHSIFLRIDNKVSASTRDYASRCPEVMVNWLLTPSHIGGLSTYAHSRMIVRNIGDPLVAALADIKRLVDSHILTKVWCGRFLNQPCGNLSWGQWGSDPYCLNIPSTMTLTKIVEDITQRGVLSNAKNPFLKDLFHSGAQKEDEEVSQFFLDQAVIMPRVAHAIIELTPTGKKIEKTITEMHVCTYILFTDSIPLKLNNFLLYFTLYCLLTFSVVKNIDISILNI